MGRKEEYYIVISIVLAALSCVAGWLAIPQVQGILDTRASATQSTALKLDGNWRGRTSLGDEISFSVSGDKITDLIFGFKVMKLSNSAYCPPSGSYGGRQAYIQSNRFDQVVEGTYLSIEVLGTFESNSNASGSIVNPSKPLDNKECIPVIANWKAMKQ